MYILVEVLSRGILNDQILGDFEFLCQSITPVFVIDHTSVFVTISA